jgi:peptide/nickel transport system permease protein
MVRIAVPQEETLDIEVHANPEDVCPPLLGRGKKCTGELYKSKTAFIGAVMLVILSACILTPTSRIIVQSNKTTVECPAPSAKHYFGTDRYGRDVWSRILGGRLHDHQCVRRGVWFLRRPLGALSGYYGGWIDTIAMRL